MKFHLLKLKQKYFNDVESGKKNFEVRKNDRDYQVGDILILVEYRFVKADTTCGSIHRLDDGLNHIIKRVSYILHNTDFPDALKEGYCVLGLEEVTE